MKHWVFVAFECNKMFHYQLLMENYYFACVHIAKITSVKFPRFHNACCVQLKLIWQQQTTFTHDVETMSNPDVAATSTADVETTSRPVTPDVGVTLLEFSNPARFIRGSQQMFVNIAKCIWGCIYLSFEWSDLLEHDLGMPWIS